MKTTTLGLTLILLAGVSGQNLFANCGNRDFSGTYGILGTGAITVPGFPITGPFARAGRAVADGMGNSTFYSTGIYNGILFNEAIPSTYEVSPDCTIVFTVPPFAPANLPAIFSGILSDNKRQLTFMIVSPPGQTISAILRKQDSACNAASFNQPYSLIMRGNVITPAQGQIPIPGEFVRAGKFTPDGKGNFSAETNANYNGFAIQTENFSGTYTVTKDCVLSIQYTFEDVSYTWSGAIIDNGQGAYVIVSNPGGSGIAGTLQRQ